MVYSTRRVIQSLALCFFLLFFSPFGIAITFLGEERVGLCVSCAFVCFVLIGLCLFPLRHGIRDFLRLVIVALPRLFILPFYSRERIYTFQSVSIPIKRASTLSAGYVMCCCDNWLSVHTKVYTLVMIGVIFFIAELS